MAHFAQLDENNLVLQVIVVNNEVIMNENGLEDEQIGIIFCKSLFGENTKWVQTSYSNRFRMRYAGIGYTYDDQRDAFIVPKPFESWSLNDETCDWDPPVPYPTEKPEDVLYYEWNEESLSWIPIMYQTNISDT